MRSLMLIALLIAASISGVRISDGITDTCLGCEVDNDRRAVLSKETSNQRFICYAAFNIGPVASEGFDLGELGMSS